MKYIIALLLTLNSYSAQAEEKRCTKLSCFSEAITSDNKAYLLNGIADFKYLFFDVYSAALYYEEGSNEDNRAKPLDANTSLSLVLKYHRSLKKEDFIKSTKAYISKLSTYSNDLDSRFEELYKAYEDVNKDDTYSLNYTDENETTCLKLNDSPKFCAKGKPFFKAFAGIWLAEDGVGKEFLSQLLGK